MEVLTLIFYIILFIVIVLYIRHIYRIICWPTEIGTDRERDRRRRNRRRRRDRNRTRTAAEATDRQGNIYTVSDDITSNNAVPPRFTDFFYLEPGSEEAARIRAQLEKDDKELPSYEEVLRMTAMAQTAQSATTVAALPAVIPPQMPAALGASNSSFATTATDLSLPPAPPYTEIDMNATVPVSTQNAMTTSIPTAVPAAEIVPSTSRAAATLEVVTHPATGATTTLSV